MRYCGGGVGHKYMREVEAKYENMSLECSHGVSRHQPPQDNNAQVDGNGLRDPAQPGGPQDEVSEPAADGGDGGESDDGDYMPPETECPDGNSSPSCEEDSDDAALTGSNESDSDGSRLAGSGGNSDEVLSDADYESYGLADL